MKKFFFILAAAALAALASCTKVTPVDQPDQEITFNVVKYVTKATDLDNGGHLILKGDFGVFAYSNSAAWSSSDATTENVYMDNVQITKQDDGSWKAATPYYWPKQNKLTFAAYAPYKSTAPVFAKATGFKFENYAVPTAAHEDLMVADVAADKTTNEGPTHFTTGVPLLFHHLLTALQFKFQQAPYGEAYANIVDEAQSSIVVKEVKLVKMVNSKTYDNSAWAANTAAGDATFTVFSGNTTIAKVSANNPTQLGDSLMVIPQTLIAKPTDATSTTAWQGLYIKYDIKTYYKSSSKVVTESDLETTVPFSGTLPEAESNAFNINKFIIYTITINPYADEEILFDPAVVDWTDVTGNAITIE